jgi:hypothetical protein
MSTGREGLQEVQEGEQPGVEAEEEYIEEGEDYGEDEEIEDETARETVERVLRESKEQDAGAEAETEDEPQAQEQPDVEPAAEPKLSKDYEPPARFNAHEKESFNKAPKKVKEAIHRMVSDHERRFMQVKGEVTAAQAEARHIVEAVRPYLLAHPELTEQGYTESKIVSGLIASHQKLTNPETAVEKWLDIGAQIGIGQETLLALREQSGASNPAPAANPEFQALQTQVNTLTSEREQWQQQQNAAAVNSITAELSVVRDEMDPVTGQYLRPELHQDAFIDQAKPLVSALIGSVPGMSYGDALKSAYQTLTGRSVNGNANQAPQPRHPNNQTPSRANTAAVSVRGRSAPMTQGQDVELPQEALGSARESVAWALQQLRRG